MKQKVSQIVAMCQASMLKILLGLVLGSVTITAQATEQELQTLLELVRQGMVKDAAEQQQRLQDFLAERDRQQAKVAAERKRKQQLETETAKLESAFEANEKALTTLQATFDERLGTMREMFGVLQQVSGDVRALMQSSPTSLEFPDRDAFLAELIQKAGASSTLPEMAELERLWFEIQREAIAAGEIRKQIVPVTTLAGETREEPVVRVGSFGVLGQDGYLLWDAENRSVVELASQPGSRYERSAKAFFDLSPGETGDLWLDPSGGSLLSLLVQSPSLAERLQQGGLVGYIILVLGAAALVLAAWRFLVLWRTSSAIRQQMNSRVAGNNPLGEVIRTFERYRQHDQETLELKLAETIQQQVNPLNAFIPALKIISVVAPLLGLLGTVTGMINTFEVMSLFGTGDPKLMAGGISQALVTTVLGLVVAIPTVMLHTVLNSQYRTIVLTLEEKAIGLVAGRLENEGALPTS